MYVYIIYLFRMDGDNFIKAVANMATYAFIFIQYLFQASFYIYFPQQHFWQMQSQAILLEKKTKNTTNCALFLI